MKRHVCADEGARPGEPLRAEGKEDDARMVGDVDVASGARERRFIRVGVGLRSPGTLRTLTSTVNGLAGRVSARPQALPPVHELPGSALLKLGVDCPGRAGGQCCSARCGGFRGDSEQTSRRKADVRQPRARGRLSALTPLVPGPRLGRGWGPSAELRPTSWLSVPEAAALCRLSPADVSVQPRKSAADPRGPHGVCGARTTRRALGLAPGLPLRQGDHVAAALLIASSATKWCARRSRGPAEGCAPSPELGGRARGFPQVEAAAVFSRIAAATVESRAWGGRRVLTVPPPGPGAPSGPSCPPAVWMMSPCPAASGAPAPSILRCNPHGNLGGPGATLEQGRGGATPETPGPAAPARSSPLHPCSAQRPRGAGQGAAAPGAPGSLCPWCPKGLLGSLPRLPHGLFFPPLVLLKRDTHSEAGAGITSAVTLVNRV
uniref:Uncharacterized protein n=1 Tax=Rangifer tarandus platyrhynchus TaxID=3082113 RepID=A0ACB0FJ96_RANTA|nr:unnamed protein product [Rangifer tarandus platyrhynchus]